jgi:hypothetical protein
MVGKRGIITICFVAMLLMAGPVRVCCAHPARLVAASANIERDGRFRVLVKFDLLAYVLNDTPARIDDASMNALLDGPDDALDARLRDAGERMLHGTLVLCDPAPTPTQRIVRGQAVHVPTVADVHRLRDSGVVPRLPVMGEVSVEGRIPDDATSVAFRFPEVLGPVVLTVERPGEEPCSEPIEAGCTSSSYAIHLSAPVSPQPSQGGPRVALKYLAMGFEHILPRGPDHILFVLGLFLLSAKLRPLLWQVTAFTLAHSITLGLALYGVVRLPSSIVEPLIAVSIAFVAVENMVTTDLKPWRPFVVFGFGLVHGLGFASALGEAGLPRNQFATALVTFNVGVELGQLSVIALAFLAVGWWRRRDWYRRAIVLPASCAIAAVALVWTIQRVCGS